MKTIQNEHGVDPINLKRLGIIMKPEQNNLMEVEGVLNPGAIRGKDGNLYLFPRIVSKGNYSRIGISKVLFNDLGDPVGAERIGIALEPEADYELRADGSGGCEDPRVTYIEALDYYLMTYTALSPLGPRIAFATSEDLVTWKRIGLAIFEPFKGIDFVHVDNKDAVVFPLAIQNHAGKLQLAMLHRPLFQGTRPEETVLQSKEREIDFERESIWISYCPMPLTSGMPDQMGLFNSHHRLANPEFPWECLKIGAGTPPVLTRHGWLILYHGVNEIKHSGDTLHQFCYSAGLMILSKECPHEILYRSTEPVLKPMLPEELRGIVSNVVFPTGIDKRDDLGLPNQFDVYYGMADNMIGVARFDLPEELQGIEVTDSSDQTV
jgi:beta-1,2-mannobiose phosphorylase / 1,2-beta-oligomannan phosphorylase